VIDTTTMLSKNCLGISQPSFRASQRFIFTSARAVSKQNFDFIVVGAGSAGCTLALRLSESPKVNVLLIEAGHERNPKLPGTDVDIIPCPGLNMALHNQPEIDWGFKTTKQKTVFQQSLNTGCWPYTRGKGLGGSSAMNFTLWVRGVPEDYNTWERLGAEGWSADACLPYFIKSENIVQAKEEGLKFDSTRRGIGGPIGVSLNIKGDDAKDTKLTEWVNALLDAYKKAGLNVKDDYNDLKKSNNVAGRMQYNIKDGLRNSTDIAIRANIGRPNLHVLTGLQASKILFQGHKAIGVQLIDHITGSKAADVFAKREIILSSGMTGSPQLLMLSGIGPKEHLNAVGIDVVRNLSGVGKNLSDHLFMVYKAVGGEALKKYSYYGSIEKHVNEASIKEWNESKRGFLSKILSDVVGFINVTGMREDKGPDVQIINFPIGFAWDGCAAAWQCHKRAPFMASEDQPAQSFAMSIAQPKSRGQILLRSSSPTDAPIIDSNFLDHPDDRETLIAAYKFADQIATTGVFKGSEAISGKLTTDEEILNFIYNGSCHGWHGSGACRMGQRDDPSAVVDPRLRVRDVDGLRVCDVSIFPVVSSGNTNAPTIMTAEKGADIIKQDHADVF